MAKKKKNFTILEYGAIKINSANNKFKKEKLIDELIFPYEDIDFNSYAMKNVNKITKEELNFKSILNNEFLQLIDKTFDKNIIFISSSCSNEINCFKSLFNKMDKGSEINYLDVEEYYRILKEDDLKNEKIRKKLLEIKKKLSNQKEQDNNNIFKERNIIYVDSGIFFKFLDDDNPKNQEDLYKKIINVNYEEKHRAMQDTIDLYKIFKKNFDNNFSNFLESLKKFFVSATTGLFLIGNLNKI
jgi:hypothetical protein